MKTTARLAPHPQAALEYWFFKVNAEPVALLVDWIARRKINEQWLRVSIHSPYKRAVLFGKQSPLTSRENFLTTERTVGQLGEVAWDLDIGLGTEWIDPDIFHVNVLRVTDLSLISAPLAEFTGWVRHGGQHINLRCARGMLSHYWGRQLASEWWWVSANQFDREGVAVECSVLRSGLWGLPLRVPLAYLYLKEPVAQSLVISPPAIAQVTGSPEKFEIQIRRFGAETIILNAVGRDYGDLGEGIINTLVGDLEILKGGRLVARAKGTAGLERRAPEVVQPNIP
jgi:hypothetical protein